MRFDTRADAIRAAILLGYSEAFTIERWEPLGDWLQSIEGVERGPTRCDLGHFRITIWAFGTQVPPRVVELR